ncbi:hypothetical protein [Streptomyces sp. NPDC012888]|uniref:hypothetical protein n=1 Tax=Streptomyces sp. NPDC012888 TaxID=3364855 RepID=UPI00368E0D4B
MRLLLAAAAVATIAAAPAIPGPAAAAAAPAACVGKWTEDSRGRSSVDGSEIAYDDESSFADAVAHARKVWTAKPMTKVRVFPDGATAYADVEFRDVDSTKAPWTDIYGLWDAQQGTDVIYLNKAYLLTTGIRRTIAAHELGHALGFCHKDHRRYATLMAERSGDMADAPTAQDKKNYTALWG